MSVMRSWPVGPLLAATAALAVARTAEAGEPASTEEHRALMISAQVMRKENKLLRSRDLLVSCGEQCGPGPSECSEIRAYCAKKLTEVVNEIPLVTLRVEDDRGLPLTAAVVELDSTHVSPALPLPVDPGPHQAKASFAGRSGTTDVVVEPGQRSVRVVVRIDLRETVQRRPVPVPVYVLGGTTLVSGLLALGTGIYTAHSYSNLDACRPYCDSGQRTQLRTTGYVADVSMIVALASAVAGTVWFLSRPTVSEIRWLPTASTGAAP
jgi:hypothetical protein